MALAKIIDYTVRLSKTNNLMVEVLFQTTESKNYRWFGSLKEGTARNITMATLVKLGLNNPDLKAFNKGIASGALNVQQEYELTLAEEKDLQGNMQWRIKQIRLPGESAVQKLDETALEAALSQTTIGDELAAKIAKHPAAPRVVPNQPAPLAATGTDEDVPF